jgi:hypothetical protein
MTARPSVGCKCMHPLEESCIDADQLEIVGRSVFLWRRWLIVIEMPVPMSQDKSFHMRPRFEAPGDTATRLPRGCLRFVYEFARLRPRSACLFDPEFTPARRTDFTVDQRAGARLLEQRAVAALLIALWCVLIFGDLLSHLGGSLLNWGKRCCDSSCASEASNDNGSSG